MGGRPPRRQGRRTEGGLSDESDAAPSCFFVEERPDRASRPSRPRKLRSWAAAFNLCGNRPVFRQGGEKEPRFVRAGNYSYTYSNCLHVRSQGVEGFFRKEGKRRLKNENARGVSVLEFRGRSTPKTTPPNQLRIRKPRGSSTGVFSRSPAKETSQRRGRTAGVTFERAAHKKRTTSYST